MANLNIKGVILSENFWMESGVTTLADFQREIGNCRDSIELEIDSQGGDVFTSNVMSTMIADWAIRHPNAKCTCIVGGLCASAAANILAKLPSCFDVQCYEDSLIMYHSAYGVVEGSPETLRDNALLMDIVNSVVITKLQEKTTLDSERIHTAFRAGREMWLSGKEAVECGLVNSIRGAEADKTIMDMEYKDTGTEAYRYVAAVCRHIKAKLNTRSKIMEEENKKETEITAEATTEIKAEATVTAETEQPQEEPKTECDEKKEEAKAEAETETEEEKKEEAKAEEEEEPKAEANAELEAMRAENAELKAKIEKLEAVVAKYTVTASEPVKAEKKSFLEMMREIPSGLSQAEYAKRFSSLKAEYKAEYDEFMASRQNRG